MKTSGLLIMMALSAYLGFVFGQQTYVQKHRAAAQEMYENRGTENDVFTACLIEGWSQDRQFRDAWVNSRVQCTEVQK